MISRWGTHWNRRAIAVLGATFSGVSLPITGLLDHAAGREWALPHVVVGVLCILFCAWHIILNRRPLGRRFRQVLAGDRDRQALIVCTAALLGLALPVTGLLDHAAGREWALPHAAPGVLCVCLLVWRAVLQRSALARYVRSRLPGRRFPARETLATAGLTVAMLGASTLHSPGI